MQEQEIEITNENKDKFIKPAQEIPPQISSEKPKKQKRRTTEQIVKDTLSQYMPQMTQMTQMTSETTRIPQTAPKEYIVHDDTEYLLSQITKRIDQLEIDRERLYKKNRKRKEEYKQIEQKKTVPPEEINDKITKEIKKEIDPIQQYIKDQSKQKKKDKYEDIMKYLNR